MKKKENTIEISNYGLVIPENEEKEVKDYIRETFENESLGYNWEIVTYRVDTQNLTEKSPVAVIELHKNYNFYKRKVSIDNQEFFKNVTYSNKIDEFLILSEFYVKYISPAIIKSDGGKVKIVELSRVDKNIGLVLESLGYKPCRETTKKVGFLYKYKWYPIFATLISVGDPKRDLKRDQAKSYTRIELFCLCNESEKQKFEKIITEIKKKLGIYFKFI